jgi:DNA-dependent RNA polymerase auxiliary subunit epsilon
MQLVNKCSKLQRKSNAMKAVFIDLKTHLRTYEYSTSDLKRENAINSIFRIIEIDSKRAIEAYDEEERLTIEYINKISGENHDMHNGT